MSGPLSSETAALRWLPKPRQVLVDPTRLWVPARHRDKGQPNLGVRAESFEGNPGEPWLPAIQYGWARIRVADYTWFAQIAIDLRTRNRLCTKGFTQWVPWDAVRLPSTGHPPSLTYVSVAENYLLRY